VRFRLVPSMLAFAILVGACSGDGTVPTSSGPRPAFESFGIAPNRVGAKHIYVANSLLTNSSVTTYDAATGGQTPPTITMAVTNPYGIAFDATDKHIYVANGGSTTVTAYTAMGKQTAPTIKTGPATPTGVAVDRKGQIYVAAGNVTVYTAKGKRILTITDGVDAPYGVAVGANGKIYVVNTGVNSGKTYVSTYMANGKRTTPTITSGLDYSDGVAVDSAGKIYVTNVGNNTVTTYTSNGKRTTPTIATGLAAPYGVAVDASGKIYVTNSGNDTVTTYLKNGKETAPTLTGLSEPVGIAVH
jgi:DNA-binding beta-propeller fold protein YncE